MLLKSLLFAAILLVASCLTTEKTRSNFLKRKAGTHDDVVSRQTSWASDTGDVAQLGRNYLDCKNGQAGAISKFQMRRNDDLQVSYAYQCTPAKNIDWDSCTEEGTDLQGVRQKTTAELMTGQAARCGDYSVLTAFGLRTTGSGGLRFSYTCCRASLGSCNSDSTTATPLAKGFINLDAQLVALPSNNVLTGIEFRSGNQGSRIVGSYSFAYCKNDQQVTNRETGSQTHGDNDIIYLDRHSVDCRSNKLGAISFFHLKRQGSDNINYEFSCTNANSIDWDNCQSKTNDWTDIPSDRKKSINHLDRQNIQCDSGSVLTQFKFNTNGPTFSKMRYTYSCCPAVLDDCTTADSSSQDIDQGYLVYLDRQNIKAKTGGVMTRFQFQTQYPGGGRMNGNYKVRSCYAR